jgi:hypothetical protein
VNFTTDFNFPFPSGLTMLQRALAISFFVFTLHNLAFASVITFEDKNTYTATGVNGSYYNGNPGSGVSNSAGWSSGGVQFNNSYNGTFDFWSGFAYSNVANSTTAGFTNQYAAFPGGGSASSQYAVAFNFQQGDAIVSFAAPVLVNSADFANTTYTAISMRDGDAFSKKFGGDSGNDLDFLRLDIHGYLGGINTGTSSLFLADYRFSDNSLDFILNGWATQNLAGLGLVDSLQFDLISSDVGPFGTNTPTYFALDNLNITAVPEPTSVTLLSMAAFTLSFFGRRSLSCGRRKKRLPSCKRAGVTMVELLVVFAIIGMLASLLLPAVQFAREAARGFHCKNNLKQIGIALHNYHDVNRVLPVGCLEWRGFRAPPSYRQLAWSAFLLPFLEQQALHSQIDFSKAFDHAINAKPASQRLSMFECPTAPNRTLVRGQTDYGGLFGEIILDREQDDGVFLYDRPIGMRDILDGTTNTIAVSEDIGGPDSEWINGRNVFVQSGGINDSTTWIGDNEIRSKHPAGAMVLFVDAHVILLSDSIDNRVLGQSITRAKQEIPSVD